MGKPKQPDQAENTNEQLEESLQEDHDLSEEIAAEEQSMDLGDVLDAMDKADKEPLPGGNEDEELMLMDAALDEDQQGSYEDRLKAITEEAEKQSEQLLEEADKLGAQIEEKLKEDLPDEDDGQEISDEELEKELGSDASSEELKPENIEEEKAAEENAAEKQQEPILIKKEEQEEAEQQQEPLPVKEEKPEEPAEVPQEAEPQNGSFGFTELEWTEEDKKAFAEEQAEAKKKADDALLAEAGLAAVDGPLMPPEEIEPGNIIEENAAEEKAAEQQLAPVLMKEEKPEEAEKQLAPVLVKEEKPEQPAEEAEKAAEVKDEDLKPAAFEPQDPDEAGPEREPLPTKRDFVKHQLGAYYDQLSAIGIQGFNSGLYNDMLEKLRKASRSGNMQAAMESVLTYIRERSKDGGPLTDSGKARLRSARQLLSFMQGARRNSPEFMRSYRGYVQQELEERRYDQVADEGLDFDEIDEALSFEAKPKAPRVLKADAAAKTKSQDAKVLELKPEAAEKAEAEKEKVDPEKEKLAEKAAGEKKPAVMIAEEKKAGEAESRKQKKTDAKEQPQEEKPEVPEGFDPEDGMGMEFNPDPVTGGYVRFNTANMDPAQEYILRLKTQRGGRNLSLMELQQIHIMNQTEEGRGRLKALNEVFQKNCVSQYQQELSAYQKAVGLKSEEAVKTKQAEKDAMPEDSEPEALPLSAESEAGAKNSGSAPEQQLLKEVPLPEAQEPAGKNTSLNQADIEIEDQKEEGLKEKEAEAKQEEQPKEEKKLQEEKAGEEKKEREKKEEQVLKPAKQQLSLDERIRKQPEALRPVLTKLAETMGAVSVTEKVIRNIGAYYQEAENGKARLAKMCAAKTVFDGSDEAAKIIGFETFCKEIEDGKLSATEKSKLTSDNFLKERQKIDKVMVKNLLIGGVKSAAFYQKIVLNEEGRKGPVRQGARLVKNIFENVEKKKAELAKNPAAKPGIAADLGKPVKLPENKVHGPLGKF